MIKCKECGHGISDKAFSCPNCGCPVDEIENKNGFSPKKLLKVLIPVLLAALIGGVGYWLWNTHSGSHQIALSQELTTAIAKYDKIQAFHCGLAGVVKDNKYGYINEKGEEVIACNREYYSDYGSEGDVSVVPDFTEDLALCYEFKRDGDGNVDHTTLRYGYINKKGEMVIPCKYQEASAFSEGLARVKDDSGTLFINKQGEQVFRMPDDMMSFSDFHDGLLAVFTSGESSANGYIDTKGNVVIPLNLKVVSDFSEGLAFVESNSFRGFIDTKGQEVISCSDYEWIGSFHEGLACVSKDMKLGFIDKTGTLVIPIKFESDIEEGDMPVMEYFSNGVCHIRVDHCFIDSKGNVLFRYNEALWASDFSEGLAVVDMYGRKYGYMDKQGKTTITDTEITKIKEQIAEETRKQEEEFQRQLEEQRRLAEQGPEWIQGTWIYSAYGMVSRIMISGRNLKYDMDGSVQYSGAFEYRDGALHFGSNYIDVDEYSQRLKADDTHYFTRSGSGTSYSNSTSSTDNNEELRIMTHLKELQNKGKELTDELAVMRNRGQMDPMRYIYIKQNLIRYKDEQISLARKLGDSQMVYEYQQQKSKIEQALRMIENGM